MMDLIRALESLDYDRARTLLRDHPELATNRDDEGCAAIHYAAEIPDLQLFVAVLEADPSLIDNQDHHGFTPLFVAVTAGHADIVKHLIGKGSQLDHVDMDKHTAVHWAVVSGQVSALQELLNNGAPYDTPDLYGARPLHYAATLDEFEESRAEAVLNALLKVDQDVNCRDLDDRTPLLWAASGGFLYACRRLIEAGANKFAVDRDALNAVHCAASHGHVAIVGLLIQQTQSKKLIDGKDKNGDTPLFYASTFGHYDCAEMLLKNDADPNHVDKRLRTAAHCAAAKGQMRILKLLRQFGTSFDMQNYRGDLPFHEAVQTGNKEIVEWILELQPQNVNVPNFYGRTALHLAAANGDLDLVKLLVQRDAEINNLMIYKKKMATAKDLADQRSHQDVVDYLSRHGGKFSRDLDSDFIELSRDSIEDNVKLAKMRWMNAQRPGEELPESNNSTFFQMLQGRKENSMNLSASDMGNRSYFSNSNGQNKEIQTDEIMMVGKEMVEEAIRKVVREDGIKLVQENTLQKPNGIIVNGRNPHRDEIANHNGGGKSNMKQTSNGSVTGTDDDYPQMPDHEEYENHDDRKAGKKVTLDERVMHIEAYNDEFDDEDDDEEPGSLAQFLEGSADRRFIHEKAIFQELTHLKRIQIQYGKVQEGVLVRSLINNFCKMHGLNPANFKYTTFYAWEKFLYDFLSDQLKLIYLEERERIQTAASHTPHNSQRFERRLRRVSPLSDRIRELTRIYASASNAVPSRRGLAAKSRRSIKTGSSFPRSNSKTRSSSLKHRCIHSSHSLEEKGGQKRCNCFNRANNTTHHNHLLLEKNWKP
ncbi:unnamed protein product [Bursaphelenchus xylophilus]|uniref:(pine wood nematode) hypothetical protein n=1 Tax=Bursaphelenchus xylophilus TaxID=6326 RepID=A0A1I7RXG5_BURXY|nr:unnamed protein product [Bursaphelenchus xylophilus]CAG9126395.1 unnamed protein product [Bursaphelenchus xylophilus]